MNSQRVHELERQQSVADLREGLQASALITYRENGNRGLRGPVFLRRLEGVLAKLGVTRVAEISQLSALGYPVFQSCRPNVFLHTTLGQNSGAQGKGRTTTQAKISCIMESIENFSLEPRNCRLVRGCYASLCRQHVLVKPSHWFVAEGRTPPGDDDVLMWTEAYSVEHDTEVLVPAEAVYFPFVPSLYGTRAAFPCSTNGVGGGVAYLDATVHGLYEVIERYYRSAFEEGRARATALFESEVDNVDLRAFDRALGGELQLQLYALSLGRLRDLPMVIAVLVGDERSYMGAGCAGDVDTAIGRAVSEALQSYSTHISGSREDFAHERGRRDPSLRWPRRRTLRVGRYRRLVRDKRYRDLHDELLDLVDWIHEAGFGNICVVNLTRAGIDVPIVKVLVPGMPVTRHLSGSCFEDESSVLVARQFPTMGSST